MIPAAEPVNDRQYATLTADGSQIVFIRRNAAGEQYAELVPVKPAAAAVPAPRDQSESIASFSSCVDRTAAACSVPVPVHGQPVPEQRVYESNGYGTRAYQQRRIYQHSVANRKSGLWLIIKQPTNIFFSTSTHLEIFR